MSDVSNNGQTHWSFAKVGTACHHGCVLAEMRRLEESLRIESERCCAQTLEIERLREDNAMLTEGRKSADIAVEKLAQEVAVQRAEIERLEEIIYAGPESDDFLAEVLRIEKKREAR